MDRKTILKRREELNKANFPSEVWFGKRLAMHGIGDYERNWPLLNRFFGDFVFIAFKLVIEIDGQSHEGKEGYDRMRDEALRLKGWRVIRIRAYDHVDGELAIERIRVILKAPDLRTQTERRLTGHKIQKRRRKNRYQNRRKSAENKKQARLDQEMGVGQKWLLKMHGLTNNQRTQVYQGHLDDKKSYKKQREIRNHWTHVEKNRKHAVILRKANGIELRKEFKK